MGVEDVGKEVPKREGGDTRKGGGRGLEVGAEGWGGGGRDRQDVQNVESKVSTPEAQLMRGL